MWSNDKTLRILYAYLDMLMVRYSRYQVKRLLDSPLGDSMRGMSDVLDALHIGNNVYRLPKEYIQQLKAPFIVTIYSSSSPFWLIEEIDENHVVITDNERRHLSVPYQEFIERWDGTILIAESFDDVVFNNKMILSDFVDTLLFYLPFLPLLLLAFLPFITNEVVSSVYWLHTLLILSGLFLSIGIVYEEYYNSYSLNKICKIGKIIDCRSVLRSKGSNLFGLKMSDFSIVFFASIYLYTIFFGLESLNISFILMLSAIPFVIYSIFFQTFILRKFCLFCLSIDFIIAIDVLLLLKEEEPSSILSYNVRNIFSFLILACCTVIAWRSIRLSENRRKAETRNRERLAVLYRLNVFEYLLEREAKVESIESELVIHNENIESDYEVIIVSNLFCPNCKKIYPILQKISSLAIVKLVFVVNSLNEQDVLLSHQLLSYYAERGWEQTVQALVNWSNSMNKKRFEGQNITRKGRELFEQQQAYCKKNSFSFTPAIIVNGHLLPDVYQIGDLEYML